MRASQNISVRIINYSLIVSILIVQFGCKSRSSKTEEKANLTSYVNPFLGTAPLTDPSIIGYNPPEGWRVWAGLTYPGSSLPNAMVQLSPITEFGSGAGYEYEDDEIYGFTHTNKGHWNLCNLPILPVSAEAQVPFKSKFTHDNEEASPGFYQVYLDDYGVNVRLTSTLRGAIHEYTFSNKNRSIVFKLGKANNGVSDWDISTSNRNEISGYQRVGGDKIHFFAKLSHDIKNVHIENQGKQEGYAKIELENGKAEEVILKVGISYVSIENAKNNLEKEIGNRSFDEVHEQAIETWEALLGAIKVKGGTKKQKQIFYSSLYRAFLWPALRSDLNGEFSDVEGKIKKADFRYYTLPSFWDTYRNKLVLLNMLQPDVAKDVIRSVIDRGENNGFIPTFFHGDHATSFISAAYNMGITDFEVQKAYDLLLNNAYKEGGTRPYISEYIEKGYIATPKIENPHVESKAKAGVSKTLEYAHDDYSLALLAKALGDSAHYEDLMKRSKNYRNVFDKNTHFMRGKLEDGTWVSPFDAEYPYYEYMYREANAWQLSFYVPHDMPGLVHLYGKEKFEEKLDSLFSTPWNPIHIARNVSGFMGLYSQGNQPDHETPFAYYFIDKPEKSQAVLDKLMQNYFGIEESENALSGMDDAGEMSSWYVFAASGVYPLSPADAEFLVSVPVFDEVTWTMPNGSILSFTHKGKGRKLKEIKVNSESVDGYFIPFQLFKSGGKVIVETGKD